MVTPPLAPVGTSLVGLAALHLLTPNPPSSAPELQSAQIHLLTVGIGLVAPGLDRGHKQGHRRGLGAGLQLYTRRRSSAQHIGHSRAQQGTAGPALLMFNHKRANRIQQNKEVSAGEDPAVVGGGGGAIGAGSGPQPAEQRREQRSEGQRARGGGAGAVHCEGLGALLQPLVRLLQPLPPQLRPHVRPDPLVVGVQVPDLQPGTTGSCGGVAWMLPPLWPSSSSCPTARPLAPPAELIAPLHPHIHPCSVLIYPLQPRAMALVFCCIHLPVPHADLASLLCSPPRAHPHTCSGDRRLRSMRLRS